LSGGKFNLCLVCRDVGAHAPSGLVRATCDLAETLGEAGHTVHVLSDGSPGPPPDFRAASYEPLTVPVASGPFHEAELETARHNLLHAAAVYRAVRRIHEHEQPVDAVLAPLWRSEGAVCLLDERFPTVISCMTSLRTLTEIDDSYGELEDIDERLSLEQAALSRSRYLHGLTQASLSKTISDYQLTPVATAVIGRGLRDKSRPQEPGDGRRGGDGRNTPPRILFVGRLERRKGVDTLLDAFGELLDDGVEATVTLAGPSADGYVRERFEQDAARPPRLTEVLRLAGPVSDSELERLYADADIVCIPSRYESHGVVLVEAMMFGKAIATCDGGGIDEVVDGGRNAVVSPPEDASALASSLRRLLADQQLRAKLGAEARATFERRFDARFAASRMESFLADVIDLHRSAGPRPDDVAEPLAQFLAEVIRLEPNGGRALTSELLDPAAGDPFRRLTAAARRPHRLGPPAVRPGIAAVVLTRNRAALLARTLDSLHEQEPQVETLVIDNASAPAEAHRVAAVCAGRERVRLRRSDTNLGTAAGRHLGITLTHSDLVLFLDDDAELLPGALAHLVAQLDGEPSAGAVSATVVSSDGRVLHSGGSIHRGGRDRSSPASRGRGRPRGWSACR
jgi:glycosyltransferase involved in cell wall biosynthesis